MAHLWRPQLEDESAWALVPLVDDALALGDAAHAVRLLHRRDPHPESWVLIGAGAVSVNGMPLLTGLHVLRDRDEVRLAQDPLFFATERLARVEALPDTGQPIYCARCKDLLSPHFDAVQCPACQVWHHQSADTPCWTYSPTCALCDQPTDLNASYRWTPEEL